MASFLLDHPVVYVLSAIYYSILVVSEIGCLVAHHAERIQHSMTFPFRLTTYKTAWEGYWKVDGLGTVYTVSGKKESGVFQA